MRRATAHSYWIASLSLACIGGCSANGAPAVDGGTTPELDAGGCGAACAGPDAGECLGLAAACTLGSPSCCPGLGCTDAGLCQPPPNPCTGLNGEQLLPSGCGCDPTLGADAGCDPGFVCDGNLECVTDAGTPVELIAQPVGAPCDPAVSYPDGAPAPPCAQPGDGGADGGTASCIPDPSGVFLYVCAQACSANRDCPLAWQSCGSTFATGNYCGDNPCTPFPVALTQASKSFFAACPDGGGLCLPFNALVVSGSDAGAVSYGLCLQASPDAGPNATCVDPPSRSGSLCDPQQLCVLGRCRNPCNAAPNVALPDAGSCLAFEVCWPLGVQPEVAGASWAAGGCVRFCELDGGNCDAGVPQPDGGRDAGLDGGAPDAGPDAGEPTSGDGGSDGGSSSDGGDGG